MKNITSRGYSAHFPDVILLELFSFLIACWRSQNSASHLSKVGRIFIFKSQNRNESAELCWPTLFISPQAAATLHLGEEQLALSHGDSGIGFTATTDNSSLCAQLFRTLGGGNLSRELQSNGEKGCRQQQAAGILKLGMFERERFGNHL